MVKASGHSLISKTSGLKHSVLSTTPMNDDRSFRISVWTGPQEIFFTGEEYHISLLFDKKTLISSKETMLMPNLFAFSKIPSLLCSLVALPRNIAPREDGSVKSFLDITFFLFSISMQLLEVIK